MIGVGLLASFYTSSWVQTDRQTDRRMDHRMMPIADHTV